MLRRLQVKNYVLIDSLEIEFPAGLIIITGQTGAGKSILLGALSLLLGAKADASIIGSASDNCVVEAEFYDVLTPELAELLDENGVEAAEPLIIRRVVNPTGRSRSFVNDSPVSVSLLSDLASSLVDIHSQHQTALLTDKAFQLSVLDYFAGSAAALEDFRAAYRRREKVAAELKRLTEAVERARRDYDYNATRYKRLADANLKEDELEELEAEQRQLANAEDIKSSLCAAEQALSAIPSAGEETPLSSFLKDALRSLSKVVEFLPSLGALVERLESCRVEVEDIESELASVNSGLEVSADRLELVEDRLSLIYSLFQSYSATTVPELIQIRDSLASGLDDAVAGEERVSELRSELEAADADMTAKASALSQLRAAAAPSLASAIESSVRSLELPAARFEVRLSPASLSLSGADAVAFTFSATGENPADVAKCASGGERSRLMLSLKALLAKYKSMPTMIFDEIDTGVSGSVADKMGSMICAMGRDMQVFAITHLPQVAAKGDAHYLVSKDDVSGRTVSSISRISGQERVREIARMLSGSTITQAAIANAESLLDS